MHKLKRIGLAMLVMLGMIGAPSAQTQADEPSFAGDYVMSGKGHGASDRPYLGTCSLKRDGAMYEASCFNEDTRHTYVGKGLAMNQTLAIFIGDYLRGDHNEVFAGEYLRLPARARWPSGRHMVACRKRRKWRGNAHTEGAMTTTRA